MLDRGADIGALRILAVVGDSAIRPAGIGQPALEIVQRGSRNMEVQSGRTGRARGQGLGRAPARMVSTEVQSVLP